MEDTTQIDDSESEEARDKTEQGIFRMRGYSFFTDGEDARVLWRSSAVGGCAFVMLLSSGDNVPLGELVLSHVCGYVTSTLNMAEEGVRDVVAHPEKVTAVTHVFLPAGQLLVMNHRVVKQLEKDLEKILAGKI